MADRLLKTKAQLMPSIHVSVTNHEQNRQTLKSEMHATLIKITMYSESLFAHND